MEEESKTKFSMNVEFSFAFKRPENNSIFPLSCFLQNVIIASVYENFQHFSHIGAIYLRF